MAHGANEGQRPWPPTRRPPRLELVTHVAAGTGRCCRGCLLLLLKDSAGGFSDVAELDGAREGAAQGGASRPDRAAPEAPSPPAWCAPTGPDRPAGQPPGTDPEGLRTSAAAEGPNITANGPEHPVHAASRVRHLIPALLKLSRSRAITRLALWDRTRFMSHLMRQFAAAGRRRRHPTCVSHGHIAASASTECGGVHEVVARCHKPSTTLPG